jgi:hypothetical protein
VPVYRLLWLTTFYYYVCPSHIEIKPILLGEITASCHASNPGRLKPVEKAQMRPMLSMVASENHKQAR